MSPTCPGSGIGLGLPTVTSENIPYTEDSPQEGTPIVDETALLEALKSGKVKRAAFDVFHDEPDGVHQGISRELIQMPNVIATPHIGGSTHEAWRRISLNAADNVIAFFKGKFRNRINI